MLTRHILAVVLCLSALFSFGQTSTDTGAVLLNEYDVIEYQIQLDASVKSEHLAADSMQQFGYSSVADALRNQTGIFVKSYGGNGVASLSFRGTGASHTNVYWNGLSIASPSLGQADFSVLSLDAGDDVDVRYGLASLVDGAGGLGGSIHLQSNARWDEEFSAAMQTEFGSFGRLRTSARIGGGKGKLRASAGFYRLTADNNFTYPDITLSDHPEAELRHSRWESKGVFQQLYYRPNLKNVISLKSWYNHVDRQLPGPITQTTFKDENLEDEQLHAVLNWSRVGSLSLSKLSTGISRGENRWSNETDSLYSTNSYLSWQSEGRYRKYLRDETLTLEAGFRTRLDNAESQSFAENVSQFRVNAHVQLEQKIRERLGLTLLLREEMVEDNYSPLLGSFGVFYQTGEFGLAKFNIARNYRFPSINDLHWNPGGNPDLMPEDSRNIELGYVFFIVRKKKTFEVELTAFDNLVDNWILWAPNGNFWSPTNVKKVHNQGFEARFKSRFRIGKVDIKPSASYTYTSSQNKEFYIENEAGENKQLIYVPFHKVAGNLVFNYRNFNLIYNQQSTTRYYISTDNLWYMPAYTVADVTLNYRYHIQASGSLNIGFSVRNILDCDYQVLPYRPEPGRHFNIRLAYTFSR